jgi:hypothetical protein
MACRLPPLCLAAALLVAAAAPLQATEIEWPEKLYDPAGEADLVLPLPCGGAMAFQKIETPVDPGDPLSDRPVRMGVADPGSGYLDYLRRGHIRGGFTDAENGRAFYFLGRYEMTADQAEALLGDVCPETSIRGAVPAAGLSWFDAVAAARRMTEWLRREAPGALPREDGAAGFLRLPTETEWEFAARGGAAVDAAAFNGRTFPMDGEIGDYAWHYGPRSSRGRLRPIGMRKSNPLGLHGLYGGVEELMLEPFRLNRLGRRHGQPGGLVTRGGSIMNLAEELNSALRQEFPAYDVESGRPMALDTFGARLAIGVHLTVTTARTNSLRAAWLDAFETAETAPDAGDDLVASLDAMIDDELEQTRRRRLEGLRLLATEARRARRASRLAALKSSILGGAVLVQLMREDDRFLRRADDVLARYDAAIADAGGGTGSADPQRLQRLRDTVLAQVDRREARFALSLTSYKRSLVTAAEEYGAADRRQALDVLLTELRVSGRGALAPLAVDFHDDVVAYAARPEMSEAEIRRRAVE